MVGLTHRLSVRAEEDVWKGLTDEENLFKNMQVSGVLHPSRTLNINSVKIEGQTLSELNRTRTLKKAVTASLKAQNAATRAETAAMQAETAALRAETVTEQTERAAQRMEKTQTE